MSLVLFDRGPPAAPKAFLNSALSFTCYPGATPLCVLLYFAAVTGSLAVGLEPIVLLWVPVCLCAALVLRVLARFAFGEAVWLAAAIEGACLICVLGLSLACLSYVCARMRLPLFDREIISADLYFGFSWRSAAEWFDHAPILLHVLNAAYATFTGQLIVTAVLLLAAGVLATSTTTSSRSSAPRCWPKPRAFSFRRSDRPPAWPLPSVSITSRRSDGRQPISCSRCETEA